MVLVLQFNSILLVPLMYSLADSFAALLKRNVQIGDDVQKTDNSFQLGLARPAALA